MGIGAQQKAQGDVAQGNASESGEQGRPGQPAPEEVGPKGTGGLNQARTQAGHEPRLPRQPHGVRLCHPLAQGGELDRQHHQKHVGKQAHRVDAIRQGRAVAALFAFGELEGLAGVGQVANHQADARGGEDGAKDQGVRVAEHAAAQPHDQQDLNQVVET